MCLHFYLYSKFDLWSSKAQTYQNSQDLFKLSGLTEIKTGIPLMPYFSLKIVKGTNPTAN